MLSQLRAMGSSPRIRGEYSGTNIVTNHRGIIPANTGRITFKFQYVTFTRDHPREYGENPAGMRSYTPLTGSSPRIRGECFAISSRAASSRIIPANTGRMQAGLQTPYGHWDHPREYGENAANPADWAAVAGSSPRIRGELHETGRPAIQGGIIPANTGRIVDGLCPLLRPGDHPREYGENTAVSRGQTAASGSSPRIRGEFMRTSVYLTRIRIIPANTGRMASRVEHVKQLWDHPREYGENHW